MGGGRTTGHTDELVYWPLPTMRPYMADTSCHPSIQIPLISAKHMLALRGKRPSEFALSHRMQIPTEEGKGPPRGP